MKTRILASALFLALLLSSCSGAGNAPAVTSDDQTTPPETETETTALSDNVPVLDFGGAEFRTIEQSSTKYSFYSAESTGDIISDTIYERNSKIEERFNVTFAPTISEWYTDISSHVKQSVMAGADDYDLVFGQIFDTSTLAMNGMCLNWNILPHMDLTKPWYTANIQKASIGDKLFMIESDLSTSYTDQTWMIVYNQTKAEQYQNFPDLYSLVREGKWTIDKMSYLIADKYQDLNGDSERNEGDFFGMIANQDGCQLAAFVYGSDVRLAAIEDDMTVSNPIGEEKSINAIMKLHDLFNVNPGSVSKMTDKKIKTEFTTAKKFFVDGSVLFAPVQVSTLMSEEFRSFEDHYGVLPIPKYDEAQKDYHTVVDGGANIMVVPASAPTGSYELIGAITESLSAASYLDLTPVYCGIALEQKGTRDDDSIEILRMILDSRVIDFAYLYDGFKGWVMKLPDMISSSSSIASKIESQKKAVTEYYTGLVNFCLENE